MCIINIELETGWGGGKKVYDSGDINIYDGALSICNIVMYACM